MSVHPIRKDIRAADDPLPTSSQHTPTVFTEPIEIIWARASQVVATEIDEPIE